MFLPVMVSLLLVLASCAPAPTHLQLLADEGIRISYRADFSSSPEAKLQRAQELVAHAGKYDQLMNRSTDSPYIFQAHRFQREERAAAITLMREAAEDYTTRKDMVRARTTYQSVVTTF